MMLKIKGFIHASQPVESCKDEVPFWADRYSPHCVGKRNFSFLPPAFASGYLTSSCLSQFFMSTFFVVFKSLSRVWLFVTPWTAACLAFLSFTISLSLLKVMSTESVMPPNHLILCHPLLLLPSTFPSIRVFSNELALLIRGPKYWSFSSVSVLPMNIQGWFPLGLTGLIFLLSKGLSRVFSSTTVSTVYWVPTMCQTFHIHQLG